MTTDPPVPDAAMQIAADALPMRIRAAGTFAHLMCEALAAAGWLHDPARVAELEAENEEWRRTAEELYRYEEKHLALINRQAARVAELEAENKRLRAGQPCPAVWFGHQLGTKLRGP